MSATCPTLITPEWVLPKVCYQHSRPSGVNLIPEELFFDILYAWVSLC